MANFHHRSLSTSSSSSTSSLYCLEEEESLWGELEAEEQSVMATNQSLSLLPMLMLDQELFCDNEEILTLLSREKQICEFSSSCPGVVPGRGEAVEWMLKANSYFSFTTLTAILSINYLDRFLTSSPYLRHHNQPWMTHLAAVACLSLAAKVEEVDAPLPLDLQVGGAEYMFEAKSIQKMELLVLSTLDWKMHPVTPVSFLDIIIPRLGLKCHLQREFLRRSEQLLMSVIAGSSVVSHLPSVLATAIMMHVIDQMEPSNAVDYRNQLMGLLNLNKEKVKSCYKLLVEKVSNKYVLRSVKKRNRGVNQGSNPSSPNGVIDSRYFDSASESGSVGSSTSSSLSSSPHQHATKRSKRVHEQYMPLRVFVGAVARDYCP